MNKTFNLKHWKLLSAIGLAIAALTACSPSPDAGNTADWNGTISAQSTWIAHLSTQIAKQEQINFSQWESIGRLYTQMPYALGIITPMPPGVTLTLTPYDFSDQDARLTFTPTPSMSIDIEYPPDMRTGIDEIDNVIDAIMGEDIDARLAIVHLTNAACTNADGLGGPPKCEPGEADGTIVDVFPVSSGEGHHVRPDQLRDVFDFTVRGMIAVYVVPEDAYRTEYWPAGAYGVVFTSEDRDYSHVITVLVEDGQIVRLDYIPGWPPLEQVWGKSDEFILPPIR